MFISESYAKYLNNEKFVRFSTLSLRLGNSALKNLVQSEYRYHKCEHQLVCHLRSSIQLYLFSENYIRRP